MERYGKTLNIYKRDADSHRLIVGEYVTPLIASLAALPIWTVTEKIDGTNMRLIFSRAYAGVDVRSTFGFIDVRGRSDNSEVSHDLRESMLLDDRINRFNLVYPDDDNRLTVTVYGEGYGGNIQGGGLRYGTIKRFAAFALKVNGRWVPAAEAFPIFDRLGLESVPVLRHTDTLSEASRLVTQGRGSLVGSGRAEGLVAVPTLGILDQYGKAIRIKMKDKDLYR